MYQIHPLFKLSLLGILGFAFFKLMQELKVHESDSWLGFLFGDGASILAGIYVLYFFYLIVTRYIDAIVDGISPVTKLFSRK